MTSDRHRARSCYSAALGWVAMALAIAFRAHAVQSPVTLERFERELPAMGVQFRFVAFAESRHIAETAFDLAAKRISELDEVFSDYKSGSEVNQLVRNELGRPIAVSSDLWRLLQISQQISRDSDGAFDVTVGSITRLWRLARKRRRLPEAGQIQAALQSVGSEHLELQSPSNVVLKAKQMQLDFGGIAKGFAADECLAIFADVGIRSALVDASGDIAIGEAPPGETGWTIGVADLSGATISDRTLRLAGCGVATSSDALQALELDGIRYSHIVDPRTGQALTLHSSVTVIAPNATDADAWASALSVLGPHLGIEMADAQRDIQALIVAEIGVGQPPTIVKSDGFDTLLNCR